MRACYQDAKEIGPHLEAKPQRLVENNQGEQNNRLDRHPNLLVPALLTLLSRRSSSLTSCCSAHVSQVGSTSKPVKPF